MDSNDELKELDIIIISMTIKIEKFNLDKILIDGKLYESILVYNISYKNLIAKHLLIRFDKINGFIKVYDGSRYLVLFGLFYLV